MGSFVDITGRRYERLVAIRPTAERTASGGVKWLFRCDCGNEKVIPANSVRSGLVKSCGCMAKPHGMTGTRLFNIWVDMRQRCQNENYTEFHLYGGRGIRVCDQWQQFTPFYEWAMANGYQDTLSIDRKDVNGNYQPENCRWATAKEQANNTRKNRTVTINGEVKSIAAWCKKYGVSESTVYRRVRLLGMTFEEALTTPKMRRRGDETRQKRICTKYHPRPQSDTMLAVRLQRAWKDGSSRSFRRSISSKVKEAGVVGASLP